MRRRQPARSYDYDEEPDWLTDILTSRIDDEPSEREREYREGMERALRQQDTGGQHGSE